VAHSTGDSVNGTYPIAGSIWRLTAKTVTNTIASQKSGIASPMPT
jgi:hypothetical protein